MQLLVKIAITLLRARFKQSLVAAIGVAFGIAMFVTLLSFMNGLNSMLDGLVTNRTPHVRLYNEVKVNKHQPINLAYKDTSLYHFIRSTKPVGSREEIYNAEKILNAVAKDPRVKGYSRKLSTQVFFNAGITDIAGFMNGIDPEKEVSLFHFKDYVFGGNAIEIVTVPNSIILGKPLAEKLMVEKGELIVITTPQGERFTLKVVGFYQSGLADFDKTQSFVSLSTVQKIMGRPKSYITEIQVKLHDLKLAPQVAKSYAAIYGTDAQDIQTANAQFETGTSVRNIITYAVGITLLIVAGFGIYNILNMMIYEKMDSIAILKATGFSGSDVKTIFMLISVIIGVAGGLAGMATGFMLSSIIDKIPFNSPAVPTITTFPVDFNVLYYLIATLFTFATTWMAGWFPARKASKIDPVVIIRGK